MCIACWWHDIAKGYFEGLRKILRVKEVALSWGYERKLEWCGGGGDCLINYSMIAHVIILTSIIDKTNIINYNIVNFILGAHNDLTSEKFIVCCKIFYNEFIKHFSL